MPLNNSYDEQAVIQAIASALERYPLRYTVAPSEEIPRADKLLCTTNGPSSVSAMTDK